MTMSIARTGTANVADALFTKLDTKQKGYINEADLKNAAAATGTDASKSAEVFKQLDSDADGKVTKSELSVAVEKVGNQLDAQLDQSRMDKASASAKPAAAGLPSGAGGGAPPAKSADSDSTSTTKYVAAADTNGDGTVSADEEAAYKKILANAEAKAQSRVQEYKNTSEMSEQSDSSSISVSA